MHPAEAFSTRLRRAVASADPVRRFVESPVGRRASDPRAANFLFGNPHELPLAGLVRALERWVVPQHKDWFAYQTHQRPAQEAAAAALSARSGLDFAPEDVLLTTGAFAGLSMLIAALTDPGDEVVYASPPWFFYEPMIHAASAVPVRIRLRPPAFDLDVEAIRTAMTPRTRAVIVNSAHNPTGRVYPAETLRALAAMLEAASVQAGRPIFLLSDEAYSQIVFDGRRFEPPAAHYPYTFVIYTYGKVLLAPGQRIGYVAIPPAMPAREMVRSLLFTTQMVDGWTFPNALMQYALPELQALAIDVAALQRRRDRLVSALRAMGYELIAPESTFYLLPRSPVADDWAFCERLAQHDVLCLPGQAFDLPGYFRISMTASDEMVDRALGGFEAALAEAGTAAYRGDGRS
jgi:aspartate aminotransferase